MGLFPFAIEYQSTYKISDSSTKTCGGTSNCVKLIVYVYEKNRKIHPYK